MLQDNSDDILMEDGEIDANEASEPTDEVHFKRERKVSESLRNSFSSLDEEKLKKRAERFGVDPDSTKVVPVTKEQMKALYESLNLPEEEIKNILETEIGTVCSPHVFNHRFEAIHLRGTEDMSTQNVFDYFRGYAPASIEWINDYSCNVVWLEPWQAARAMIERSNFIVANTPAKRNSIEAEAMDHEEAVEPIKEEVVADPLIPIPPGVWRQGVEYPQAKALLMRFATRADRKIKGAERLSQYYRNYGNPNFGGMTGLISSSRKRRLRGKEDPPENLDSKNPWGSLAEAWGAGEPDERSWEHRLEEKRPTGTGLPTALVRRLGHQPPRPSPSRSRDTESENSDDWESNESDSSHSSRSSNQEMGRSRKKRLRMRMYADEEEEKSRKKKLNIRLKDADAGIMNGRRLAKARTVRPVHTRLGPSDNSVSNTKSGRDLRQRLGTSSTITSTVKPLVLQSLRGTVITADSDDDEPTTPDHLAVDLRSKLQSRLGAK